MVWKARLCEETQWPTTGIWVDAAFAEKDSASAEDRNFGLACSLTSYRVAAGSATSGLVPISATGHVCAG
jgi:hypothetical protein